MTKGLDDGVNPNVEEVQPHGEGVEPSNEG